MLHHIKATKPSSFRHLKKVSLALDLISLGVFLSCFLLLALNADKGLDITDRSYYLLWAEQPANVTGSITHFGFVTSLLYTLVGKNIEAFRLAGAIILPALGLGLALAIWRYFQARFRNMVLPLFSLSMALLSGSLFHFHPWLHAPSYNWLALTAVMLAVIGLLLFSASPVDLRTFPTALMLTSLGGVLAFIAKPTTALLLAVMAAVWILSHSPNRRGLSFAASGAVLATFLLLVFAWVHFGSVSAYLDNLRFGLELSAALGGGHTLPMIVQESGHQIQIFWLGWLSRPLVQACLVVSLVIGISCVFRGQNSFVQLGVTGVLLMSLAVFLQLGYRFFQNEPRLYLGTVLLTVLGMLIAPSLAMLPGVLRRSSHEAHKEVFISCLLFALFLGFAALAPAFGTSSNIVRRTSEYAVFWAAALFAALTLLTPDTIRRCACALLGLLISGLLLIALVQAYEHPYRLPGGIKNQNTQVTLFRDQTLEVDALTARYIRQLRQTAQEAGWKPGTPLIDMTGGSPGALLILESRIPGTPWLLGNYPGSDDFASMVLNSVDPAVLDKAWILTAPQGERSLGPQVLLNNGLDYPHAYIKVGSLKTGHRREDQDLWKPRIDSR